MHVNQSGFRATARVRGVHHTTVITGVKQVGELLPDAYAPETVPEVGELDELQIWHDLARLSRKTLRYCKCMSTLKHSDLGLCADLVLD